MVQFPIFQFPIFQDAPAKGIIEIRNIPANIILTILLFVRGIHPF